MTRPLSGAADHRGDIENIVRFVTSNDRVGAEDGILARDTPASCSSRSGGSPRPVSCWLEPPSPDRETALFQTGRTQPGLGRLACGRASDGLKDADKEMGPASGTLRPQQAGSRDGSGAPSPKNLPDKSWVCAQARPMRKAFRPGYKANQPSIRPTQEASSPCSKPNQLLRLTACALIRVRAWPGGGRRMDTRESAPAVRNHRPTGDDTMQMATTLRRRPCGTGGTGSVRCLPRRSASVGFIVIGIRTGAGSLMRCSCGSTGRPAICGARLTTKVKCLSDDTAPHRQYEGDRCCNDQTGVSDCCAWGFLRVGQPIPEVNSKTDPDPRDENRR